MSSTASTGCLDANASRDVSVPWSHSRRRPRPLVIGSSSHYAQEHKLTVDFYAESSERAAVYLSSFKATTPHGGRGLTSYHHLTQCTIPALSIGDNWLDTEESLQYSQQLLSSLDDPCHWSTHISNLRVLASRKSRFEIPILGSGKNLDLLVLTHSIYNRQAPLSAKLSIPPLEVDESGGEGLSFPCWADQLMKHFDRYLGKETIQDGEDSIPCEDACSYGLADTGGSTKEEISSLIDVEFAYCKKIRSRGTMFSSPLLPSKHTYEPFIFIPDNEARFIESFSETASLLDEDIKKAESQLKAEYDRDIDPQSELQTPPESSPVFPLPQLGNQRASSLKVDVPLSRSNRPIAKSDDACGIEIMESALRSVVLLDDGADAQVTDLEDASDQIPFLSTEIATRVHELGQQALRRVEQERLGGGSGSCQRVAVPIMDFTLEDPDWKRLTGSAVIHFKSLRLTTPARLTERIKVTTREEKELRWRPLMGTAGRVSFSESLDVSKQASAQLLDMERCDAKDSGMDLGHLSERRTLLFLSEPVETVDEIGDPSSNEQPHLTFLSPESPTNFKRIRQPSAQEDPSTKKAKTESKAVRGDGPALLDSNDNDGVGGLLMGYLQIRAPDKALPTTSGHFPSEWKATSPKVFSCSQGHAQPPWGNQAPVPQARKLPAPFPEFHPTETARGYIVSTTLGVSLIRHLDQLCSTAKLYVRDFSSRAPLSSSRPTAIRGGDSALVLEADVPLSSSTGVVVTNLAQLRQRPLGGIRQTKLCHKILSAATLYTKLIVLISLPNLRWSSDDTRAYAEFIAFVGALDPSIEAVLVGEGEECIAKWIVSLMNEHRYEGRRNEHLVVQEEASWEPFFRLGGMNVYAAQVLAGALKASYGDQGLSRFVGMRAEERLSTFEAVIGARRPLENLNRWLGQKEV